MHIKKLWNDMIVPSKKIIIVFLLATLLLGSLNLLSLPFVYSYCKEEITRLQNEYDQNRESLYAESRELPDNISYAFLPLYASLLQMEEENADKSYAELLSTAVDEDTRSTWNYSLQYEEDRFFDEYGETTYYLKNTATGSVLTNNDEAIWTDEDMPLEKNTWFMKFAFDENGNIEDFQTSADMFNSGSDLTNNWKALTSMINANMEEMYGTSSISIENPAITWKPIKNVQALFIIKTGQISPPGDVYRAEDQIQVSEYIYHIFRYSVIGITLALAIFMFLKQPKWHEMPLVAKYTKHCYFDVLLLITFITYVFLPAAAVYVINNPQDFIMARVITTLFSLSSLLRIIFAFTLYTLFFFTISVWAWNLHTIWDAKGKISWKQHIFLFQIRPYWKKRQSDRRLIHFEKKHQHSLLLTMLLPPLALYIMLCMTGMDILYGAIIIVLLLEILWLLVYKRARDNNLEDYRKLFALTQSIADGDYNSHQEADFGEFEQIHKNLTHINDHIEDAIEAELQSRNMRNELVTNVSHDLKTPLTSMISYIDLLKDDTISETERKKYLDILTVSSNRLKHLIEDLFEVSKANSGSIQLQPMNIDLISLLKQVEMECENLCQRNEVTIRNRFHDDKLMISLDPQKTYRIFENLIGNAAKYALPKSRIFIEVNDYEDFIHITIRNISKEEITYAAEELMERFVRGDASRNSEGSGLGLAIAKSFCELQKGSLQLQIDGDLFKAIVRLPRINDSDDTVNETIMETE